MKQLIFYSFLAILIFSSCKKCPVEPAVFEWPAGTGDYAPYTIGSGFTYEYTSISPAVNDSFTLTVTKDTTINGLKYYKLVSSKPALAPTYFVNYNNGDITEITYNLDFLGLITVPVISENTLKVNATVNTTWNDADLNLNYSGIPVNVTFAHTLVQKYFVKVILGKDYANTMAVKEVVNINLPIGVTFPGVPSTIQYDNLYAQGVGLVQRDVSTGTSQKIKYYNVVK
jgi:hypothetical protein